MLAGWKRWSGKGTSLFSCPWLACATWHGSCPGQMPLWFSWIQKGYWSKSGYWVQDKAILILSTARQKKKGFFLGGGRNSRVAMAQKKWRQVMFLCTSKVHSDRKIPHVEDSERTGRMGDGNEQRQEKRQEMGERPRYKMLNSCSACPLSFSASLREGRAQ
jgi:hypothetical protein